MKTKNFLYLIAVFAFTILFYRQNAGINFVLFACILLSVSAMLNKKVWKTKQWLIIAAGTFMSAFFVAWYSNSLTIVMAIFSIIIFNIIKNSKRTSYFIAFFTGIITLGCSVIFMILGKINANRLKQIQKARPAGNAYKWWPIIIVTIISFIFIALYSEINPVFNIYFKSLYPDIDPGWLIFALFGTILLYTFIYPSRLIKKLLRLELDYGKTIEHDESISKTQSDFSIFSSFEHERFSAFLLFIVLNILLLILNAFDIQYLFLKGELPASITYADYVHRGVGAVILSILLAIGVISYYFRGLINFDIKSKFIKTLTYLWIIQNIVLVIMTAFKNQLYIDAYSLTYKRIGVYYYLAFAIIGLLLTLYKIYSRKDTWFLFRSNSIVIYVVLILSCAFNWNTIVTRYNLENSQEVDYCYLNTLGFQNYPLLWESKYYDPKQNQEYELQLTGKTEHYLLPREIGEFLMDYESTGIQSYSISREKTYRYFLQLAKSNKLITNQDTLKEELETNKQQ